MSEKFFMTNFSYCERGSAVAFKGLEKNIKCLKMQKQSQTSR